jgi:hypothetical protein
MYPGLECTHATHTPGRRHRVVKGEEGVEAQDRELLGTFALSPLSSVD